MHDSGQREQFPGAAQRDNGLGKPLLSLLSPYAKWRLGEWLTLGAQKYAARNWEKGMPISRCMDSLLRHADLYLAGDDTEDHMAAVMCNAMFIMDYEERINASLLEPTLEDGRLIKDIPRHPSGCVHVWACWRKQALAEELGERNHETPPL